MIVNFQEKPYIKLGKNKIKLVKGDYIIDNTQCLQFIPNEKFHRWGYKKHDGVSFVYWRISKKELKRLLNNYQFNRDTRNYMIVDYNGELRKVLTAQIINEYYFLGKK